jgi:hypothetical protein
LPTDDLARDFEMFWKSFPRKQGKLAAEKKYAVARRRASAVEILAGVERYKQHLPDDPQFICMAGTFLHQGRWMDEYDDTPVVERRECPHTPRCHSPVWCDVVKAKESGAA